MNSPRFRDLSPKQIVPTLADDGVYLASESSMYRLLRRDGQLEHRGKAGPAQHHRPDELVARGPNQVWSWDITWMPSLIRGKYFYLYTIVDVFSRKIVGLAADRQPLIGVDHLDIHLAEDRHHVVDLVGRYDVGGQHIVHVVVSQIALLFPEIDQFFDLFHLFLREMSIGSWLKHGLKALLLT